MLVSGKIKQKSVANERVSILIGETWISAFINADAKIAPEVKDLLRELIVGDEAQFECVENVSKKTGQTYRNIVGVIRVTRLGGPNVEVAPPSAPSAPSARVDAPKEGDTRVRSMLVAYCKDLVVAGKIELTEWREWADTFENYVSGK